MEVHAPTKPLPTFKAFVGHIGIVTLGVLIALAFEGALEWRNHRASAREASENIRREIADNAERLKTVTGAKDRVARETGEVLAVIAEVTSGRGVPDKKIGFHFPLVTLSAASWNSAHVTGALSHMKYDDVQRFSAVYEMQQQFTAVQQHLLRDSMAMMAVPDFEKPSPREMEEWRQKILNGRASFHVELQLAEGLSETYRQVLAKLPAN